MSSPAPVINSVSPSSGSVAGGTQVTILGRNFVNGCRVRFGGVDSPQVTFLSSSQIMAVTPPAGSAGPVNVRVVNTTQVAGVAQNAFQYIDAPPPTPPPVPVVTSVTPPSGPLSGGTQVTVSGQNFVPGCVAKFGGVEAQTTFVSDTRLSAITPAAQAESSVTVRVLNPNQSQAGILQEAFRYVSFPPPPPGIVPVITSVSPSSGPISGGTQVTITGGNFSPDCRAKFGGVEAQTTFSSSTQLNAITPQAQTAGPVNVRVVNASQQAGVAQNAYTYVQAPPPPPIITSVTPSSGPAVGGTLVTITGQNFAADCQVKFGGALAQLLSFTPSALQVLAPMAPGPGPVTVRVVSPVQDPAVAQNAFTYTQPPPATQPPVITSVSPSSGPVAGGTRVDINGQGFALGCSVKIGDVDALDVNLVNPTQVKATTPARATPGLVDVKLKNPGVPAATLSSAFGYDAQAGPTITSVTPNRGPVAGNTRVDIAGANFDPQADVKFGNLDGLNVQVLNPNQIRVTTPACTPGGVEVKVKNPGLPAATLPGGFTYEAPAQGRPAPTVGSLTPAAGPEVGNDTVIISGDNFYSDTKPPRVVFGGTDSPSVTLVDARTLRAVTPPRATPDLVNVKVVNPDGQAATKPSAYQYEGPPELLDVFPPQGPAKPDDPQKLQQVTLRGRFLHADSDVYFGKNKSPQVRLTGGGLAVLVPPGEAAGSVAVRVEDHTNGQTASLKAGFTYLGPNQATRAHVFRVEPLTIIEDTPSQLRISGRNLADAIDHGLLALRVPPRAVIKSKGTLRRSFDEKGQFDILTFDGLRIAADPPLAFDERIVVQVVASRRPKEHVAQDMLVETSAVTFTLLPRDIPVPIAFNAKLAPGGSNLIIVAGGNMELANLEIEHAGPGVSLSYQRADTRVAAALLDVDDGASGPVDLLVKDKRSGREVGRYPLRLTASARTAAPPTQQAAQAMPDPGLEVSPVSGQKMIAPTRADARVYDLGTPGLAIVSGAPNLKSQYLVPGTQIQLATLRWVLPIFDEVRLFPLFDRGGYQLVDSPLNAKVGRIFGVRGLALLLVLRIELEIDVDVALFVGFNPFSDFESDDPFNEFARPDEPVPADANVFGSLVLELRVTVSVTLRVRFFVGLLLPDGSLRTLASFQLDLTITVGTKGSQLNLGAGVYVRAQFGPKGISPNPIRAQYEKRLLLVSSAGHPSGRFDDPLGLGFFGYYLARVAQRYCLYWTFDIQLIRGFEGTPEGPPEQDEFEPAICLLVAQPTRARRLRIDPPFLSLTGPQSGVEGGMKPVRALAQQFDEKGNPVGVEQPLSADEVTFAPLNANEQVFEVKKVLVQANPPVSEWRVQAKTAGEASLILYAPTSGAPERALFAASLPDPLGFLTTVMPPEPEAAPPARVEVGGGLASVVIAAPGEGQVFYCDETVFCQAVAFEGNTDASNRVVWATLHKTVVDHCNSVFGDNDYKDFSTSAAPKYDQRPYDVSAREAQGFSVDIQARLPNTTAQPAIVSIKCKNADGSLRCRAWEQRLKTGAEALLVHVIAVEGLDLSPVERRQIGYAAANIWRYGRCYAFSYANNKSRKPTSLEDGIQSILDLERTQAPKRFERFDPLTGTGPLNCTECIDYKDATAAAREIVADEKSNKEYAAKNYKNSIGQPAHAVAFDQAGEKNPQQPHAKAIFLKGTKIDDEFKFCHTFRRVELFVEYDKVPSTVNTCDMLTFGYNSGGGIKHKVQLSTDGGKNFEDIGTPTGCKDFNTFSWRVPPEKVPKGQMQVDAILRISISNDNDEVHADARVKIITAQLSVRVLTPTRNQRVKVGATLQITWASAGTVTQDVLVSVGGNPFQPIKRGLTCDVSRFDWQVDSLVPPNQKETQAIIRVSVKNVNGEIKDGDSMPFTIVIS